MNEYELLRRYTKEGDESAFAAIVERYLDKLYGVALRRTGNRMLAEEIVQDVFTALAKKAHSMDANAVLACWLHRAATLRSAHVMRSEYRRQRKMKSYSEEEPAPEPADPVVDGDLLAILDQAIDDLDARDRELVLLRFFEDLSIREIASRLGISSSSAQRHADRALEKLSSLLKRWDVALPVTALAATLTSEFAKAAPASLSVTAVSQSALTATISSATVVAKLTTILAMTKIPIFITAGGLLVFLSTKGGVQLGRSQALSQREASIERAAVAKSTQFPEISQPQLGFGEAVLTENDSMAMLIAKILQLATDETLDPEGDDVQALLSQISEQRMAEAIGYLDEQRDTRERDILGGLLLMRWSQLDGAAAGKAAFELAEGTNLSWYTTIVASTWSKTNPSEALAWQQNLPDNAGLSNNSKRQMLRQIFKHWALKDRHKALEALAELSYDDQKAGVWGFANNSGETQRILKEIGGKE